MKPYLVSCIAVLLLGISDQSSEQHAEDVALQRGELPHLKLASFPAKKKKKRSREEVIRIQRNTVATRDGVRIACGNIWDADYVDEKGAKRHGLTAGLWIWLEHGSGTNTHLRVHPGQRFDLPRSQRGRVISIEEGTCVLGLAPAPP